MKAIAGRIMALNSAASLSRIGAINVIGQLVSVGIVRELGPVDVDRALLGSTAERVVRAALCPVMLIPPMKRKFRRRARPGGNRVAAGRHGVGIYWQDSGLNGLPDWEAKGYRTTVVAEPAVASAFTSGTTSGTSES